LTASTPFSKRYLKYLTKKYLKKNQLEVRFQPGFPAYPLDVADPYSSQNFLRVVATDKDVYSLRYFKVDQDEEADEE
jgi:large subunit ribosomal protein L22e